MKHFIKLKHNNPTSPVNTGTNNYKGTYPLSRQTQPTHAEQIETAKRNTGTHRTTKDRNSLNLEQQTNQNNTTQQPAGNFKQKPLNPDQSLEIPEMNKTNFIPYQFHRSFSKQPCPDLPFNLQNYSVF